MRSGRAWNAATNIHSSSLQVLSSNAIDNMNELRLTFGWAVIIFWR